MDCSDSVLGNGPLGLNISNLQIQSPKHLNSLSYCIVSQGLSCYKFQILESLGFQGFRIIDVQLKQMHA